MIPYWAENQDRLISDTGIQLRINRSIQVEGAFGVLKQDLGFRRFFTPWQWKSA